MKKILCFGDSNTWGHNPADCSRIDKPWPRLLFASDTDVEIAADGVCGRTTRFDVPNENGKNGMTAFNTHINANQSYDLLILMLGTNDTLKYFTCDAAASAEVMREYIKAWKGAYPKSEILLISPMYIMGNALVHPIFKDLYTQDSVNTSHLFEKYYSRVALEENVHFMDAAKIVSPSNIDGIHMDAAGHRTLAKAIETEARKILAL